MGPVRFRARLTIADCLRKWRAGSLDADVLSGRQSRPMFRRLVAVIGSFSIVGSALAAPMMHVHDDAGHANAPHVGRVVHSHTHMHGGATRHAHHGTALEPVGDSDTDARAIDPFQMVVGWSHPSVASPHEIASPPAPALKVVAVRMLVQHSHDPPLGRPRPSRAPPAVLS